jgi:hypothetical protein
MENKNQSQKRKEKFKEKFDIRAELRELEQMITDLKTLYDQYFLGILPLRPEKLHGDVKRKFRRLFKLPFKSSQLTYRLKMLENRFTSYNSFWERVLREKEAGVYSKDLFKANIRQKNIQEDQAAQTEVGAVNKQFNDLYQAYVKALQNSTNRTHNIDFNDFKKSLISKAKQLKEKGLGEKFSFKIVMQNGKVAIKAQKKESKV